jgi:hypothetical protein
MLVCYVVVAFRSGKDVRDVKEDVGVNGSRLVDTSIPGNVNMCGVATDLKTAKAIVAKNEHIYGAGNIVIYNTPLHGNLPFERR